MGIDEPDWGFSFLPEALVAVFTPLSPLAKQVIERLDAINARRKTLGSPPLSIHGLPVRLARHLPVSASPDDFFLLLGAPKVGSKTFNAFASIRSNYLGRPPEARWTRAGSLLGLRTWGRVVFRVPLIALLVFAWFRSSLTSRERGAFNDCAIYVGLELVKSFLRRNPKAIPVLVDDLSIERIFFAFAASYAGNDWVFWQSTLVPANRAPTDGGVACLLNLQGERKSAGVKFKKVFSQPVRPTNIGKSSSASKVIIVVNAYFDFSPVRLSFINALRVSLEKEVIHLRLHPRANLNRSQLGDLPPWLNLVSSESPLSVLGNYDYLAIAGNSASQIELLVGGVPVVHVSNLDPLGFDAYGFVNDGLVFGWSDWRSAPDLTAVDVFYTSATFQDKLSSYRESSSREDIRSLGAFLGRQTKPQ